MPRAGPKQAPGVDVQLDNPDGIFLPGDTISGVVVVDSTNPLSGGSNNVHIKVYGRCKVLIVRNHGEGKDYFRGRASLFDISFFVDGPPVSQTDNKESWRFSLQIPTHTIPCEIKSKINDVWKVNPKFLDNAEMDVSQHPLPGVFYYCGESGGTKGQCYVEYVLEASVRPSREVEDPNDKKKKKMKAPEIPTTILPFVVRTRSTEHPIQYSEYIQDQREDVRFRTLKLLPQFATGAEQLGFKHSLKSVFQPSKIPSYFFDVKVVCPSTIQLDNPSSFPFRISIVPKTDSTTKPSGSNNSSIFNGADVSKLPDVKITAFMLCLKMMPMMRARMMVRKWDATTEKSHDFAISPDLPPHMVGYVIPREEPGSTYRHPDESNNLTGTEQYLDLGQLLNMQVSRTHSTRLEGDRNEFKTKRPLWPSFKSYNIHLQYQWKYKITITCAGETQVVEGKQAVELIRQSEEQEQTIALDKQGIKKKWKELMEGAEGVGEMMAIAGEIASELD